MKRTAQEVLEILRRSEVHMKAMSSNRVMMEHKVRDRESEKHHLKDTLSRVEMEMPEERERWRAEKEERRRTALHRRSWRPCAATGPRWSRR